MFQKLYSLLHHTKRKQMSNPTIDIGCVKITLTNAQLKEIEKQTNRKKLTIIERVQSYEDACYELGKDPHQSLPFPDQQTKDHEFYNTVHKLLTISEALREGKILNWNDSNEYKYYPWFYLDKPGFRVGYSCFYCTCTRAGSARLCVDSREKSDYFGKHFLELWKIYNGQ